MLQLCGITFNFVGVLLIEFLSGNEDVQHLWCSTVTTMFWRLSLVCCCPSRGHSVSLSILLSMPRGRVPNQALLPVSIKRCQWAVERWRWFDIMSYGPIHLVMLPAAKFMAWYRWHHQNTTGLLQNLKLNNHKASNKSRFILVWTIEAFRTGGWVVPPTNRSARSLISEVSRSLFRHEPACKFKHYNATRFFEIINYHWTTWSNGRAVMALASGVDIVI